MSMTFSSATAAAKAAKAELTAPVAPNRGGLDRLAAPTPAPEAKPSKAPVKTAPSDSTAKPAAAISTPRPMPASAAVKAGPSSRAARSNNEAATGDDASDSTEPATGAVTALFAQMLSQDAATDVSTISAPTPAPTETGNGANISTYAPTSASLTPALVGTLLSQSAATTNSGSGDSAPRSEAINATAALNPTVTRLNLSAAGIAVASAATPAPAAISAPVSTLASAPASAVLELADNGAASALAAATLNLATPAGTPQNLYALANSAALGAQAKQPQQSQSELDAPAPVGTTGTTAESASAVAAPLRNEAYAAAPLARLVTRVDADDSGDAARYSTTLLPTAVKDDGTNRASLTAPAPSASNANLGVTTPASNAPNTPAAVVKLAGAPEQWQQPLRDALGDRLQVQLQRNNDHAVIRLEPPNMGSIEISIRHSGGALQVNLSANHSEVLRQLNTIGDSVRQDLSTRQFSDVSVTVTSSRAQAQADTGGRSGQQRDQEASRERGPGRALADDDSTTFAMTSERE